MPFGSPTPPPVQTEHFEKALRAFDRNEEWKVQLAIKEVFERNLIAKQKHVLNRELGLFMQSAENGQNSNSSSVYGKAPLNVNDNVYANSSNLNVNSDIYANGPKLDATQQYNADQKKRVLKYLVFSALLDSFGFDEFTFEQQRMKLEKAPPIETINQGSLMRYMKEIKPNLF